MFQFGVVQVIAMCCAAMQYDMFWCGVVLSGALYYDTAQHSPLHCPL